VISSYQIIEINTTISLEEELTPGMKDEFEDEWEKFMRDILGLPNSANVTVEIVEVTTRMLKSTRILAATI